MTTDNLSKLDILEIDTKRLTQYVILNRKSCDLKNSKVVVMSQRLTKVVYISFLKFCCERQLEPIFFFLILVNILACNRSTLQYILGPKIQDRPNICVAFKEGYSASFGKGRKITERHPNT